MTDVVSGTDTEVTELTGIDLEGAPPCTCHTKLQVLRYVMSWKCGKPSRARVLLRCGACGATDSAFLCRVHVRLFLNGRLVVCKFCGKQGRCRSNVA